MSNKQDGEDVVVEFTPTEIDALESGYNSMREPLPRAEADAAKKIERKARPDETETLRDRMKAAEALAASERARRLEAEKAALIHSQRYAVAEVHVADSQAMAVDNALAKVRDEAAAAKAAHSAALEDGDYTAATKAMERMTETSIALRDLSEGKAALADRQRDMRDRAKLASEAKVETLDKFEQYVGQFGTREQAWLREHPECVNTPRLNKKVLWAHDEAVEAKIKPGTDEYFAYLDKHMGYEKPQTDEEYDSTQEERAVADDDVVVDTAKPKAAALVAKKVAAPVSRDGTITRQEDGKFQVRLTAEQKQMAIDLGMTPTAYAKRVVEAEQNKKTGNGPRFGAYGNQ